MLSVTRTLRMQKDIEVARFGPEGEGEAAPTLEEVSAARLFILLPPRTAAIRFTYRAAAGF